LKIAMEAEPSPLAGVISNILQSSSTAPKKGSMSSKPLPPLPRLNENQEPIAPNEAADLVSSNNGASANNDTE
jgi:hypothetical protein